MDLNDITKRLDDYLKTDSEFILSHEDKDSKKTSANGATKKQFASYLVSVVTHPVGISASIRPFNASLESMLAYLMDMLKFSETQLKKMLIKDHLEDFKSIETPATSDKRHSWQPELRVRVLPPVFYQSKKSRNQLDDLSVRVYLFKEDQNTSLGNLLEESRSRSSSISGKRFLDILSQSRSSSATATRPTSEMCFELRFVRGANGDGPSETYKAVVIKGSKVKTDGKTDEDDNEQERSEFRLKIRRCYCQPKTTYILRLEFWLENSVTRNLNIFRRLARSVVNTMSWCSRKQKSTKSSSKFIDKSLYGCMNVKLSQIPSYAARVSYPILDARDVQINTCELITELKNRRLSQAGTDDKSIEMIVNHTRLYAFCICHQLSSMKSTLASISNPSSELQKSALSGITLDNLLYLPAYTIINQHRLQANLSILEDQSLRRSALLLLLRQFDKISTDKTSHSAPVMDSYRLLLTSMIQHEYLIAHRLFDGVTMQEVDPFRKDMVDDDARDVIIGIEYEAIQRFVNECLRVDRLKNWVSKVDSTSDTNVNSIITLSYLRLVRVICDHNQNNRLVNLKLIEQAFELIRQIDKLLSTILNEELTRSLVEPMRTGEALVNEELKKTNLKKDSINKQLNGPPVNIWQNLLNSIRAIDNDLILHWTEKGLDGLDVDIRDKLQSSQTTTTQDTVSMKDFIKGKVSKYLAN